MPAWGPAARGAADQAEPVQQTSARLAGLWDPSASAAHLEMHNGEFVLLGFSFALAHYFLPIPSFLPFGMVTYILAICNLLFYFDFTGGYS